MKSNTMLSYRRSPQPRKIALKSVTALQAELLALGLVTLLVQLLVATVARAVEEVGSIAREIKLALLILAVFRQARSPARVALAVDTGGLLGIESASRTSVLPRVPGPI